MNLFSITLKRPINEIRLLEAIMASVKELNEKLDQLAVATDEERQQFLNMLGEINAEIQGLKDQIAAGAPATTEQLAALSARLDDHMNQVTGIVKAEDRAQPAAEEDK